MNCTYNFCISPPRKSVSVAVSEEDADGLLLEASFRGNQKPFNDRTLLGCLFRFPMQNFKVIIGIHWEAARLWMKGLRVFRHARAASVIASSNHLTKRNQI